MNFETPVSNLIKKGINAENAKGETPLTLACCNNPQYITELIAMGVDVNKPNEKHTPLMLLALHHPDYMEELLKAGAQPNIVDNKHISPLSYFIQKENSLPYIKNLLQYGANVEICKGDKERPLLIAARDNPQYIPILLEHKANVDAQDRWGWTPLMSAVASGYLETEPIQILLAAGANPKILNQDDQDYLMVAQEHNPGLYAILEKEKIEERFSKKFETSLENHKISKIL